MWGGKFWKECAKWDELYGEKVVPKAETLHEKIQRYKEKDDRQNDNQPYRIRDKGVRWSPLATKIVLYTRIMDKAILNT